MDPDPRALTKINVSIGTAVVLGLAEVPMAVAPTTAYLMLGGRCLMNCAFCAQARESQANALNLSRVVWPEYDLDTVVGSMAEAAGRGDIRRACVQVTVTADAFEKTLLLARTATGAAPGLPFDAAILPRDLGQVRQLVDAGVDHVGFGLDAASARVFRQVKGGSWAGSLRLIERTAAAFAGHAAVHLIVGLGETEKELVERLQWAHDLGVTTGLFAFTPVRGTLLAGQSPPSLATYRRMQAARWVIVHDLARLEEMVFDAAGRLTRLGAELPTTGEPFQTCGCRDCNRPFYNELPGGPLYNYPRPLTSDEEAQAIRDLEIEL